MSNRIPSLSNLDMLLRVQMQLERAKLHEDLKTIVIYVTA